ncbi:2-hydroxyacid dehydrogenase [Glutamicibacter creatinolyticus]|uniref:2-hydroxyacid dehydrogenase n=1 Tax=Glutamicibacter creatinolyticus TaxID=162496 RepID=UPI003216AAE6
MLRVLVPSHELARRLDLPGVEPIVWHLNDTAADAPPAQVLVTERPRNPQHRARVSRIPGLEHVHLMSIGYEWVLEHLPAGVGLSNSRGAIEDATAEHCLALVLAALRGMDTAVHRQREQRWEPTWGASLHGARVLLLGYGGVGQEIERRLLPFKPAQLLPVARTARTLPDGTIVHGVDELDSLLPHAEVVIVALPHTDDTQRLVNQGFLARMRDGALLVNIGRGAVVDTPALLAELEAGRLRAALDVTDPEPLPAGHRLWQAPGCLITAHVGGNTHRVMELVYDLALTQVQALAAGTEARNMIRAAAASPQGRVR